MNRPRGFLEVHHLALLVREFHAYHGLARDGATIRTDCASSAMARSFFQLHDLAGARPGTGANSNVVMTGPIWIAVTLPRTP